MSWHADTHLLTRYAADALDDSTAWSLERHVTSCQECRSRLDTVDLPDQDDQALLDELWRTIAYRARRPRRSATERLLLAMRVPPHVARLLAATPSLTVSWLVAVAAVLGFGVAAAHLGVRGATLDPSQLVAAPLAFLLVAPLVPLAGVAAAFGPRLDPTYEVGVAAPIRGTRLLLIRAVAVLAASFVLTAVAALALPQLGWSAAAWIAPALALTTTALALSTWLSPLVSATAIGSAWVGVVLLSEAASEVALVVFRAESQRAAVLLFVAAAIVVVLRRERFDLGTPS